MDIEQVAQVYQQLTKENLSLLETVYHDKVQFEDPVHTLNGWPAVAAYFDALYTNVIDCRFDIHYHQQADHDGFLVWTMSLQHPKLRRGTTIQVHGTTHLKFADDLIIYHRDYFDLGEMLYENLPLLGNLIKRIKTRLMQ